MKVVATILLAFASSLFASSVDASTTICECDTDDSPGSFKCSDDVYVCPGVQEVCDTQGSNGSGSEYYELTQEECEIFQQLEINDDCPAIIRYATEPRGLSNRVCYPTVDGITTPIKVGLDECDTCTPYTEAPSFSPSVTPSASPSATPSLSPSGSPSNSPSATPSVTPSSSPSVVPSSSPSGSPSNSPSATPSVTPSSSPSVVPSSSPSGTPSEAPSANPSSAPTEPPNDDCVCEPENSPGSFKCSNYVYYCPGVTVCENQGSKKSVYYELNPEECRIFQQLDIDDDCPAIERYRTEVRGLSNRVCYSVVNGVSTGFKVDNDGCKSCDETEAPALAPPVPSPTPRPPVCEKDVTVINTVGVTHVKGTDAVEIISQDTETVTIGLKNAWTDDCEVDQIYYQYKLTHFKEDCFNKIHVPGGSNYDEITMECFETKPFALLKICVADNGGALETGDNAVVPQCCHDTVDDDTPIVCYTIVVNCESACDALPIRRALRGAAE